MNLTQKISQMTPKGADLAATDLIEVSTLEAGSYVTKSITGQELIDAIPLPPSGLTIGTTPIASGTIGRVLFEGTGNVLQQSGNLFWDGTNNRLGIGTSTPAYTLDMVGSRFLHSGTTSPTATTTLYALTDTTNANQSYILFGVDTTGGTVGSFVSGSYLSIAKNGTGAIRDLNLHNYDNANINFWTSNTQRLRIFGNGNVGINTTTDAGFKLDVNGTARVQGQALISNGNNIVIQTPAAAETNHGINWQTTGGQIRGFVRINWSSGEFKIGGGGGGYFPTFYSQDTERMRISSAGNVLINTTTDAGFRLDVNGTARVQGGSNGSLQFTGNYTQVLVGTNGFYISNNTGSVDFMRFLNDGRIGIGTNAPNASSSMEIASTTRGFLPPRMTTTQRNAIASPAAGLIVYDTTLNLPHFFNGTIWVSL
jgi:hypothetical protein